MCHTSNNVGNLNPLLKRGFSSFQYTIMKIKINEKTFIGFIFSHLDINGL